MAQSLGQAVATPYLVTDQPRIMSKSGSVWIEFLVAGEHFTRPPNYGSAPWRISGAPSHPQKLCSICCRGGSAIFFNCVDNPSSPPPPLFMNDLPSLNGWMQRFADHSSCAKISYREPCLKFTRVSNYGYGRGHISVVNDCH